MALASLSLHFTFEKIQIKEITECIIGTWFGSIPTLKNAILSISTFVSSLNFPFELGNKYVLAPTIKNSISLNC